MKTHAEEFKKIMSNLLLADPITITGLNALTSLGLFITEEEYLKELYVKPFTLYDRELNEIPDINIDPDYTHSYIQQVELNALRDIQTSFENRLRGLNDSLFIVKGGAGSGKTTYVHHLQQEFNHLKFCFCDFEKASKSIALFGTPYDFESKFDNNVWKFVSIVISKIDRTLFKEKNWIDFSNHTEYIKKILEKYRIYFSDLNGENPIVDEQEMWEFFKCFGKYVNGEESRDSFEKRLKDFIVFKFDEFDRKQQHKEVVAYVCGILIRLLLCLNRISDDNSKEKKYICVIDNIESFIPFDEVHPIQECELQTIMNGVYDSTNRLKPTIQKWKKKYRNYKTFFAFLLVTRDTSVSLAEYSHYDDYIRENEIDISTWFCIDDVYNKKINYFKEQIGSLEENTYYKAYRNALADVSRYNWGMNEFICQMFNNNYRRIGIDLVKAIAHQPESELEYFNTKWKYCQNHLECHTVKHLCRKFIFRILLDQIQSGTQYFDKLLVEKKDAASRKKSTLDNNDKSSYARKVATILYRVSLAEKNEMPDHFTLFPELVRAVLKPPYEADKPSEEEIRDLASVLYLMNETRNQYTNWAPLILIKFDIEQAYNQDNLKNQLIKQWKLYESNGERITPAMQKYGVRIRSAGIFFAKMVPDFEYFACRFAPMYPALFVRENLQKNSEKRSYNCLDMIQIVRKNAFQCIDEVINRDNNFFSYSYSAKGTNNSKRFSFLYDQNSIYKWIYTPTTTGSLTPHPWRILNHHIGYLRHYMEYVDGLDQSELCTDDKNNIVKGVQAEIEKYNAKLKTITEENRDYLNN